MSQKYGKRMFTALMAAVMLLSGCGAAPGAGSTETEAQAAVPEETEPAGPRYQVAWARDAVIYEVNIRQYTREGTFDAFAEHLQTLKDMGINTLWFMPIHPISETKRSGTLGSYYSVTDYREVNPEFGTAEDFKAMVDKAHDMGFKIMLAEDDLNIDLLDRAFDMNYNLGLYDTLVAVAHDAKTADRIRTYIPDTFPDGTYTMNFLDNHDKNSYERTIIGGIGRDALPAMFSLIYTIPGTPMIYTGNEIGLDHAIAFMEKDAIDWDSSDVDYRPLLAELAAIRSENGALHSGNYGGAIEYIELGKKAVLAFARQVDGNTVTCLFNLTKRESTVDLTGVFSGTETVLLHGQGAEILDMEDYPMDISGEVTLKPWEFWIVSG